VYKHPYGIYGVSHPRIEHYESSILWYSVFHSVTRRSIDASSWLQGNMDVLPDIYSSCGCSRSRVRSCVTLGMGLCDSSQPCSRTVLES
jgi:hypothetical protein